MADPEDRTRLEGVSLDGRPRRQPPTIDVEAVEVSLDGSRATASDQSASPSWGWAKRILTFLSPMTLGIIGSACVIAGIIAVALWIYVAPNGVDGPQRNAANPEAAVSDEVTKPETVAGALPSQASGDKDLASRMAAVDTTVASLRDRIAALERAVRVARERADEAAGLLEGAKKSADEPNRAQEHDRTALEDLAHRIAALESRQTALQQKQEGLDRLASAMTAPDQTVRVATVAVALRGAVERNSPFTAELAAARSLGLDERALASLAPFAETGLPTRDELIRGLSALMPELRRLSVPPGRDLGYLDRLQASAVKMLNIRPVGDEPGDDPATVMSRIEFRMAQRDIEATVAELDKLLAPARELAQPWRTKALARQEALESARLMAAASLAKLGEPAARGSSPP